jgi:hypothetical protein
VAKLTKKALKQLIKECLVEILVEGIGDEGEILDESIQQANLLKNKKRKNSKAFNENMLRIQKQRNELDKIRVSPKEKTRNNDFTSLTDDSVMQSIFADTAKTTLVEQVESKKGGPVGGTDSYARIANENDPMELFENSSRWESLAFMEKKPS